VLAGDPAGFTGQLFRTGMVPLDSPPVRSGVPVYLAALGPKMLALAGRIADGVILNLMSPAQAGAAARVVRAAAQAAGRDPAAIEIVCVVHACLSADAAAAAEAARQVVPRYILHPAVGVLFGAHDASGSLQEARQRTLAGDRAGAAALVPQQVAARGR
jgi:5,10-methylenetetrahydromethanopterin reductase